MQRLSSAFSIPLLVAVLILTSCESTRQKRAAVAPPMRAQAPTVSEPAPPSSAPQKVQEKLTPKPDPVEQMVAAAEKEYQAGRANYTAGHLEAAKDNFDRAFDSLLSGPVNVKSDDRLQQQFDKIVEGVHQLEMVALKEGDGFTEQRSEPAPIDEANEVTFPVDPSLKARAEEDLKKIRSDLPLALNDAVASYINYFSKSGRGFLERGYVRSGRYRDMILKTLEEEGVPQDLIYLAQAESGFHPLALSRAGARGMWQFMAGRGLQYGLNRNWWVDDRQDPVKATRAAAQHLKDLHKQFGDWYLAMAAYNSGPGTVQRAVERTGYADYWELYRRGVLPKETRNYVPIILAITIMSKNPEQHGLDHLKADPPLPADTLTISYPVDLRLVAECVDTSVTALQELNPSLLRLTTPKDGSFDLRLPAGTKAKFEQAIAAIPADKRVWWRYHRVQTGDTLAGIARKYRTTVAAIEEVNTLRGGGDDLQLDSKLVIPVTPGRDRDKLTFAKRATRYKVRNGDTVLSVADDFGVPVESLRKWNRLKGNTLKVGRILSIHRPLALAGPAAHAKSRRTGGVSAGRSKLRQANASVDEPASARPVEKPLDQASKSPKTNWIGPSKRVVHRVRKGDTLSSIASTYKTTVTELRRNNHNLASNLHPGDVLVIRREE